MFIYVIYMNDTKKNTGNMTKNISWWRQKNILNSKTKQDYFSDCICNFDLIYEFLGIRSRKPDRNTEEESRFFAAKGQPGGQLSTSTRISTYFTLYSFSFPSSGCFSGAGLVSASLAGEYRVDGWRWSPQSFYTHHFNNRRHGLSPQHRRGGRE